MPRGARGGEEGLGEGGIDACVQSFGVGCSQSKGWSWLGFYCVYKLHEGCANKEGGEKKGERPRTFHCFSSLWEMRGMGGQTGVGR